jgi:hypothetical protein
MSVAVEPDDGLTASRAEAIGREEICRLELVFSLEDGTSMLNRWIGDPLITTSNAFDRSPSTSITWRRLSRGACNVSMRRLRDLRGKAAADGCRPRPAERHELVVDMAEEPYRFDGRVLRQLPPSSRS